MTCKEKAVNVFELMPDNGRKSFYGKAKVYIFKNGDQVLYSYDTPIIRKKKNGDLFRIWDGWSATTGCHIKAFCGLNKAGCIKLPFEK